MSQSGNLSAVGLAPESTFRNVPLTGATNPYPIGSTTNPLRYMIVLPSTGLEGEPEVDTKDEIDGDVQQKRVTKTGNVYQGDISWNLDSENGYYPFLGVLGRDVQTTAQAVDTTHNTKVLQHVLTPNFHTLSYTMEEDFGDKSYGRLSSGVVVQRVDVDLADILTAKMTLMGHRQIPNSYPNGSGVATDYTFGTSPSILPTQMGGDGTKQVGTTANPTYVDVAQGQSGNGPLIFAAMGYGTKTGFSAASTFIMVNGTAVPIQILTGSSISIERVIDSRKVGGSGMDHGVVTGGKVRVTGKLVALFADSTLQGAAMGFKQCAIDMLFTGPQIGNTGQYESIEFHVPHAKLTKAPVQLSDGPILINAEFTAIKDVTLGYTIQVTMLNTFDTTTGPMGGTYVPPCVTAGTAIANNTVSNVQVNTSAGFTVGQTVNIAGATSNPYTILTIPDGTHLTMSGLVQCLNGPVQPGSLITPTSGTYGVGGLGGWANS